MSSVCRACAHMLATQMSRTPGSVQPREEVPEDGKLGVQTPNLFLCNELGPLQAILGNLQAILGNLLGLLQEFSGNFRQFWVILAILGGQSPRTKKKTVLIHKKSAEDCTTKKNIRRWDRGSNREPEKQQQH